MSTPITDLKAKQVALRDMKPKDQVKHLLMSRRAEIAAMLPRHLSAERLLKVAQMAATTTPELLKCELPSLLGAIAQCAQLGLEPNTVLGHAYLVPFNTKRKEADGREYWVKAVQVIVGYKGLIDLARRSGQIVSIAAHAVREQDDFDFAYGLEERLYHRPRLEVERGAIIAFYAVAKLKDGGQAFEVMSRAQVDAIMRASQSKGEKGPWQDHYEAMGRKTVIRRLAKYLPLSIELATATALDGLAEAGQDQHLEEAIAGEWIALDEEAGAANEQEMEPAPDLPPTRAQQLAVLQERLAAAQSLEELTALEPAIEELPTAGGLRKQAREAFEQHRIRLARVEPLPEASP